MLRNTAEAVCFDICQLRRSRLSLQLVANCLLLHVLAMLSDSIPYNTVGAAWVSDPMLGQLLPSPL